MIASLSILFAGLILLGEHVDVRWNYDTTAARWSCQMVTTSTGGAEIARDPDLVFLPLSDRPYRATSPATSGARNVQPSNAAFAFTGAAAGSPLWIAPSGTPGNGEAWPGLENTQNAGTFGSYLETDTRLAQPQTIPMPWIKVSLKGVRYEGPGSGAQFSMWTGSGSSLRVWMATSDGIGANDFYLFTGGSHAHMNWGFSQMGIYRIRLAASAFRGPGQTNPTGESEVRTLTFAVGPYAVWQAARFPITSLEDPAVSGPTADPDGDGMNNLLEFALGTPPLSGTATPEAVGLGTPVFSREIIAGVDHEVLTFPRRRTAELTLPLLYTVESSGLTPSTPWQAVTDAETTVGTLPGATTQLNALWETVRIQRPAASTPRFLRVKVEQPDG